MTQKLAVTELRPGEDVSSGAAPGAGTWLLSRAKEEERRRRGGRGSSSITTLRPQRAPPVVHLRQSPVYKCCRYRY